MSQDSGLRDSSWETKAQAGPWLNLIPLPICDSCDGPLNVMRTTNYELSLMTLRSAIFKKGGMIVRYITAKQLGIPESVVGKTVVS